MAGGMLGYPTAAGPLGGQKRKGETPTEGFGIGSTVSRPTSRRVRDLAERCCSCTRHSNCSTTGPFACACECHNAGQQCTGCYCWGRCKNRGQLMQSPTTARDLLGVFLQGADLPANDQQTTTPPVRLPTSLYLREISAAGAGGRGERGGASGRKGPRDGGGRSAGEGGRNRDGTGYPYGESETGTRTTAARRKMAEQARRGRGQTWHQNQVSSDGEGGEYRARGGQPGGG